jgi:LemA protein
VVGWFISTYNKLTRLKILVEEGWSAIDVFLKKRYDLIPNLVEAVKGYATHERETLEGVILARRQAMNAVGMEAKAASEGELGGMLSRLMAVSERYPELKANANFMAMQQQLTALEGEIERARRYYNGTVRENNIKIRSFPSNLVAGMFHFNDGVFFEIDKKEKEVPKVSF